MWSSPASVFLDAEFFVDLVLRNRVPGAQDDEGDQRALRGHVEAEREAEELDGIELMREERNDEAEDDPQREDGPHQTGRFRPVSVHLCSVEFLSHARYSPLSFACFSRERENTNEDAGATGSAVRCVDSQRMFCFVLPRRRATALQFLWYMQSTCNRESSPFDQSRRFDPSRCCPS